MICKINFFGLGKLGLPLATCFAKNNILVNAIDLNTNLVEKLKKGNVPWYENQLERNIVNSKNFIEYFSNTDEIVDFHNTSVVLVSTPSQKDGSFSNEYIFNVLESIIGQINVRNHQHHHIILSSTVMPGSVDDKFIPLIESKTRLNRKNCTLKFSYIPDFVAIGQVINDFENPDFLMIGGDEKSFFESSELYQKVIKNNSEISHLTILEAEIAKVSLNAYITTKISFANYIKLISQNIKEIKNIEVNDSRITETIGLDERIGRKYFKPGASYGGTCFPRDTWAMIKFSEELGMNAFQMRANEKINNSIDEILFNEINKSNGKIALIGLGFKPKTAVVTEGLASKILRKFHNTKTFYGFDYHGESFENMRNEYGIRIDNISYNDINNVCDLAVICTPEKFELKKLNIKILNLWK
jgi:UDPglucose 6-dehydrogenase